RQRARAACVTAAVAGLVGDDRQQPGPERRALAEAGEGAPGLHEAVLGGVLGIGGRPRDEVGRAKRDLLVFLHELGERRLVYAAPQWPRRRITNTRRALPI